MNQLEVIINESGLEQSKAQVLLTKFSDYFAMAAEWERKASQLIVTSETQKAEMKMAREARLFLKQKRVDVENTRKSLKDQSLREGQTIDAIAKILKNLIEPIEKHCENQEKFIEIKEAREKEERKAERVKVLTALQYDFSFVDLLNMPDDKFEALVLQLENERDAKIEAERLAELQRLEAIQREAEERERIRIENERLRAEAIERERVAAEERKRYEAELAQREAERKAMEAKAAAERQEAERIAAAKLAAERAERERVAAELAKQQQAEAERIAAERKAEADRLLKEKKAMQAPDKEKIMAFAEAIKAIELPSVTSESAKTIVTNISVLKTKMVNYIIEQSETL